MQLDAKATAVRRIASEYAQDLDLSQEDHELAQDVLVRFSTGGRIRESASLLGDLLERMSDSAGVEIVRVSNIFASIEIKKPRKHPPFMPSKKARGGQIIELVEGPRNDRERAAHERIKKAAAAEYQETLDQLALGNIDPENALVREKIKDLETVRSSWGIALGRLTRAS